MQTQSTQKAQKIVPVPTLSFTEGHLAGHRVRLEEEVATLGRREDNAYVVDDPRVSRVHAEIRREGSAVILSDLGSSSGTKVNGEAINGPAVIRHGDKVSFGPVTATFEDPAAASEHEDATMVLSSSSNAAGSSRLAMTGPRPIFPPWRTIVGPVMRVPSTEVPEAEPRSVTMMLPHSLRISACTRETRGSATT